MIFTPVGTGKLNDGIYALRNIMVNAYLIQSNHSLICIDAGINPFLFKRSLKALGIDPTAITHVFLTHSDYDHTGGLPLMPQAKVYVSADEIQMTDGRTSRFAGLRYNSPLPLGCTALKDGKVLTIGDVTIKAIATPGHTPGAMSYLVNGKHLFVGDTASLSYHRVKAFPRFINMDTFTQKASLRKLAKLQGVTHIYTGHSGYTDDFDKAMRKWK